MDETQSEIEQEFFGRRPKNRVLSGLWSAKVALLKWALPLLSITLVALVATTAILLGMFGDLDSRLDAAATQRRQDAIELAKTRAALCHLKASIGVQLSGVCKDAVVLRYFDPAEATPTLSAQEAKKTRIYLCAFMRRNDPVTFNAVEQTTGAKCEASP